MAAKHYYLFNWRVWSIVVESGEDEEEEIEAEYALTNSTQLADGHPPSFGFTPWMPHYLDEEDTE